jgi:putative nucleotidyltransferase with HDIG domain
MAADQLAAQMEKIILNQIDGDRLSIPSMPMVAIKCLDLTKDPDCNMRRAVQILEQDAVLAARVLRIANSSAYSGGRHAASLNDAVMRLGLKALRTLLIEASARQVFASKDKRIVKANHAVWEHSLAVALVARDLATLSGQAKEADMAYLAGLLHDIGKPIVAALLLEAERMITADGKADWVDSNAWLQVVGKTHRPVGTALATKWELPEIVRSAIQDSTDYDGAARGSAANFVRFANAVAKQAGIYAGPVDPDDVNAMLLIGRSLLNIDDEILGKVSTGLADRIKAQLD